MSAEQPTGGPPAKAEFERQLDQMIQVGLKAMEQTRPTDIPDDARLWAALTPGWTEPLAEACNFPGTRRGGAHPLFERMLKAGVLTVYAADDQPNDVIAGGYYVMTPTSRADVLQTHLYAEGRPAWPAGRAVKSSQPQSPIIQALQSAGRTRLGSPQGAARLLATTAQIGGRMQRAGSESAAPQELQRWSMLAVLADKPDDVVQAFERQVAPAFSSGDVAVIRDWIEAARSLAALLEYAGDAQLSIAIGQAGRAVELLQRRRNDLRHLASFHRREEQVEAVRQLLDGPDDLWALHFIGPGGVGKTMVLRYITCLLAHASDSPCAQDDNPFPEEMAVARIDFDYLNLDYPRLHPGLLLEAFALELRPAATSQANKLFDAAQSRLDQAHQKLMAEGYRIGRPSAHPFVVEGIRYYNDALRELGKRVLLILDTCEELAKADPEGGPNSTLDETFRILRAVHEGSETLVDESATPRGGVPSLRVIFSGRRLLANRGAGWTTSDSKLPPRPYLRLHETRGFTHEEARRYLEHSMVPGKFMDAVIQSSSPDAGISIRIDHDDWAYRPEDVPRCNPYQLRPYMNWALENPPPDPATLISAAAGQYVELRIVQRLRNADLKKTLPLAALLGHFDLPTLRAASDLGEVDVERVFDALQSQEWMGGHRSGSKDQPREILDIVAAERGRMVTYYAAKGEPPGSARARAASYLKDLTLNRDLQALDWSDFDAGLRVMEHNLTEGAEWWAAVEVRLLSERDPDWILDLLSRLTAKDGAAEARDSAAGPDTPPENKLRPLVLATQARAWLHKGAVSRLEGTWREVANIARAKDGPLLGRLYRLALAGQIAATRPTRAGVSPELAREFWKEWSVAQEPFSNPQDAASATAAAEALVDAAEMLAESHPLEALEILTLTDHLQIADVSRTVEMVGGEEATVYQDGQPAFGPVWLADSLEAAYPAWVGLQREEERADRGLLAFSSCLAGRALQLQGEHQACLHYFRRSFGHGQGADRQVDAAAPALWADWLPPENLTARLRLEFARTAYPALLSAAETLEAIGEVLAGPATADLDRLQSLALQLRLAVGRPSLEELAPLGWIDASTGAPAFKQKDLLPKGDSVNAHRLVPPLVVSVCKVFAALGLVQEAVRQLRYVVANGALFDLETVRHAERALLRLIRRLRLNDENEPVESTLPTSGQIDDHVLTWSLAGLDGAKRPETMPDMATFKGDRRGVHGAWQCSYALDADAARRVVADGQASLPQAMDASLAGEDYDFDEASLNLDVLELRQLAEASGISFPMRPRGMYELRFDPQRWHATHPDQPGEALCLLLRSLALVGGSQQPIPPALVNHLGQRRAAEIALEQAEMLALRLPDNSQWMLDWAVEQFRDCDDPQDAFFAGTLAALLHANRLSATRLQPVTTSPDVQPLLRALEEALHQYDAMRARLQTLPHAEPPPDRKQLDQLVVSPTEQGLDALHPLTLRPWLVRLLACMARRRQLELSSSAEVDADPLRIWLETHYGALVNSETRLPAEWSGYFVGRIPALEVDRPATTAGADLPTGRVWPILLAVLGLILGLLTATFFGWRWIGGTVFPRVVKPMSLGEQLVAFSGTLVALALLAFVGTRWLNWQRSTWAALRQLEIDIRSAIANPTGPYSTSGFEPTSGQPQEVRFQATLWTPRLAWRWPPYRLVKRMELPEEAVQVVGIDRYQTLAQSAPPTLAGMLNRLSGGVRGRRPLAVWLKPRGDMHGPCWEAMFALALPGAEQAMPTDLPLHFKRAVEATRPPPALPSEPYHGVSLAVTEVAAAVVQRAVGSGRSKEKVAWRVAKTLEKGDSAAQAVHVVGSVIPVPSGLVLRLAPERSYYSQIERRPSGPASALHAVDLRRMYPEMRICILQGYPDEGSSTRLESDRYNAFLTRVFAAATASEGVAVIVIPALDPAMASTVWEHLFNVLPRYLREGISALPPALAKMRTTIKKESADEENGWELTLDMCMYDLSILQLVATSRLQEG